MGEHPKGWRLLGDKLERAIAEVEDSPEYTSVRRTPRRTPRLGVCARCGRDQRTAGGCKRIPHTLDGASRDPIPVGSARDLKTARPPYVAVKPGKRCKDCNALHGCFHHPGCKLEACPFCPMPAYRCNCH